MFFSSSSDILSNIFIAASTIVSIDLDCLPNLAVTIVPLIE